MSRPLAPLALACGLLANALPPAASLAASPPAPAVETIYSGGTILTMVGDQPSTVEALAVGGGRILYAGPLRGLPAA
ncbi:MAG: hypothetical protein ACK522_14855, partial [Synechococcaceae cyanobacterium]